MSNSNPSSKPKLWRTITNLFTAYATAPQPPLPSPFRDLIPPESFRTEGRSLQSPNDGPLLRPARDNHGPSIPLPILPAAPISGNLALSIGSEELPRRKLEELHRRAIPARPRPNPRTHLQPPQGLLLTLSAIHRTRNVVEDWVL
ncbi:hypothetical protein LZL87_014229 [Fusarium oxysporum]|nr:hypothetical protein LZL87_014229 [Fusarium oxysporum]